jgi:hypothetical protein
MVAFVVRCWPDRSFLVDWAVAVVVLSVELGLGFSRFAQQGLFSTRLSLRRLMCFFLDFFPLVALTFLVLCKLDMHINGDGGDGLSGHDSVSGKRSRRWMAEIEKRV